MRKLGAVAGVVLAALAPFAVVEIALRVAGWRPAPDPYLANFAAHAPVFERVGDQHRLAPGNERTWHAEPFPAARPGGVLRVFAVGDSVTWGHRGNEHPEPLQAWPEQLQALLRTVDSGRPHQVVNVGARTFASRRVAGVVREVAGYAPDLVIGYFGSSEHLEARLHAEWQAKEERLPAWLRSLRVTAGLAALLQRTPSGLSLDGLRERDDALRAPFLGPTALLPDEAARAKLLEASQANLDAMAGACRERGVRLVLATVPSHLRFPPFATRWSGEAAQRQGEDAVRRGKALLAEGRAAEALALLEPLAKAEPGAAALQFRLAQAREKAGDLPGARLAYLAARDTDMCPLRALGGFNERVRAMAGRGVIVADVERRFEQAVPDGIPDDRLFLDDSHPTEQAHALIAEEMLRAMHAARRVRPHAAHPQHEHEDD